MKQIKDQSPALVSERRIIAWAFITHERMGCIDFVPGEVRANFFETGFDRISSLEGDMRVLPAPEMQQLSFDFAGSGKRIVILALAETVRVDIGRIKASCRQNMRIHGGPECQMPADADTHRAQPARAVFKRTQVVQRGPGILVKDEISFAILWAFPRSAPAWS
jgi:hypothetical protein